MARYRDIDMSARLLPVSLEAQIVPGSFAHAVYHLVGESAGRCSPSTV